MNKVDLALKFLENSILSSKPMNVIDAFELVNEFENEAIKRNLYIPEKCPKCFDEVKVIDLKTQGSPLFRVMCMCVKKQNADLNIAVQEWWDFINDR
jgi:hypothetical protein